MASNSQLISSFIKDISNPDRSFLLKLQKCYLEENKPDFLGVRSFDSRDVEKVEKIRGDDDEVEGIIYFNCGEVFQGVFTEDLSYCEGKLYVSTKSEKGTTGTWTDGQLNGLAQIDNDYGGFNESFFINGVKHGVSVEFGPNRRKHFMKFSWNDCGVARGLAIKGLIGGVLIFGKVSKDSRISDKRAAVLMPDLRGAFQAIVEDDVFVRGQQTEVAEVVFHENVPTPRLGPVIQPTLYRRDVSSPEVISGAPLLSDPWEVERVEARPSGLEGAGEGLFALREFEAGDLVALYNGTRTVSTLYQDWSDYR